MRTLALFVSILCAIQALPLDKTAIQPKILQPVEPAKKGLIVGAAQDVKQEINGVIESIKKDADVVVEKLDVKIEPEEKRRHHGGHGGQGGHGGHGGHGNRNPELQRLVDDMWQADQDKPHNQIDWGNPMDGNMDQSSNPLIANVDENVLQNDQYQALLAMYQANVFTPNVCEEEQPMTGNKLQVVQNTFNAFVQTPMFQLAYKYMRDHGVAGEWNEFSQKLWNLWMGTYSRCHHRAQGSSGWEHVFIGEWKGNEVDGQHSWVKYYTLQQADQVDYYGYKNHDADLIGSFQYTWENHLKRLGGFFLNTSPAFDFSLLTVCALTEPGANGCRFMLENFPVSVTSYTQSCDAGICLATAYPAE